MKTINKLILTASMVLTLTACSTMPVEQTAQQRQNYQVQVLKNNGGDIQRQGNKLLVFLPTKILFGPKTAAIQSDNGIKLLRYTSQVLSTFHMKQTDVVVYYIENPSLAKQRGEVVHDYLWDAHVRAPFVFVKTEKIDPRSNEIPRVELQIQLNH